VAGGVVADTGLDPQRQGIAKLLNLMTSGSLTALALADHCLDRITALDGKLNAVIEINPDARDIAAALDGEWHTDGSIPPLHGIPVLIKDNIDTADRMQTTAGSLALEGSIAARDAGLVSRPPGRRLRHSRQDQSQRMGQHAFRPLDQRLVEPGRADLQSIRPRPLAQRLQFRFRRGRGCRILRRRRRFGNQWLYHFTRVGKQHCRHQAYRRVGFPCRYHSHQSQPGYGRAHGAAVT
jgi:hypothetical protein